MNAAVTTALRHSIGSITCLLDADDRYLAHKLHAVVEGFRGRPAAGLLVHRIALTDEYGKPLGVRPVLWDPPTGWYGLMVLESGESPPGLVPTVGLCFRREVLVRILPLPETERREWRAGRGWDNSIAALALLTTEVVGLKDVCAEYRLHGANAVNPVRIDAEYLRETLQVTELRWQMMHQYLARNAPDAARSLGPLAVQMWYQRSAYLLARVTQDPRWPASYQALLATPRFRRYPWLVRTFWRVSAILPHWLFLRIIDFLWGRGNRLQRAVLGAIRATRRGRFLRPRAG